jgi:hypothetical protein
MLVIALVSVCVYRMVALGGLKVKAGFIFLVPLASCLVLAALVFGDTGSQNLESPDRHVITLLPAASCAQSGGRERQLTGR